MIVTDALGRSVALARSPRRIVSLAPSLAEYLFAIGAGERVVGVADSWLAPADGVARLPKLRGPKNLDRDPIAALRLNFLIASKEENRGSATSGYIGIFHHHCSAATSSGLSSPARCT